MDLHKRQGWQLKEHSLYGTVPDELEVQSSSASTESVLDVDNERVRKGQKRPLGIVGDSHVKFEEWLTSLVDGTLPKVSIYVQVALPPAGGGTGRHHNNDSDEPVKEGA